MTPIDLTKRAPRSPKEQLGGLCMLPRMIDIARARLAGGDIGQYQIGRGMSALVLKHLGMNVEEFVEAVRAAEDEQRLAEQLVGRRSAAENRLFNLSLRKVTVADVPDDLQESFVGFYGAGLPPDKPVLDVLEEDDERAFGPK